MHPLCLLNVTSIVAQARPRVNRLTRAEAQLTDSPVKPRAPVLPRLDPVRPRLAPPDARPARAGVAVRLGGGVGKPWGVVVGCLLITVIANGLDIMGVSSHWQRIVKGAIIVLAVLIDIKGKSKKN